jgi:hypothetical protein
LHPNVETYRYEAPEPDLLPTCLLYHFCKLLWQSYFYNDHTYDNPFIYEFGLSGGTMNCITDVGGANSDKAYYINELRGKNFKLVGGVYVGVMYENFIGARLEGSWGSVQADDRLITSTAQAT